MASSQPAPLVILDFDQTLVDVDSSEWVAAQLGCSSLFDQLRWEPPRLPWHLAMNAVLRTLHRQGVSVAQIRLAASSLPLPSETASALKAAHALGCQLHILSDANTFFIEALLSRHGLLPLIKQIHSNPAWVDAVGCLHYDDYHDPSLPPHGCPLCPPNMCKGSALEVIRAAAYDDPACLTVIYGGDGPGDLCPASRLHEGDHVLPRQGYPLLDLLAQHPVKAMMHPWTSLASALQDAVIESTTISDRDLRPFCHHLPYSSSPDSAGGSHVRNCCAPSRPRLGLHAPSKMVYSAPDRTAVVRCRSFQSLRYAVFAIDQRRYAVSSARRNFRPADRGKAWNSPQLEFCRTGSPYQNSILNMAHSWMH